MRRLVAAALVLLVAACGGAPGADNAAATAAARVKAGIEAQAPPIVATAQIAATSVAGQAPAAAATARVVATTIPGQQEGAAVASIADRARAEAARALGVPAEQLVIERVENVQWRDASLGCAEPGKVYAQVITPGVRVIVASPSGQRTEVHADQSGRLIVCKNPTQ